ncbi:protein of unknown function UPF0150 [Candidatus Desulforudis audaxviator MP104C]|uniref:HicB-like antitoxin of toxin-antitoxin system domain-containing protein n=1 Tax=Desulforudis audaxviator (strain MP104C) TaxID=477974 RepID=B1I2C3_DESAP|nr:protein of unknown function UPF0150 [Candidatus Desulforudis audaxviator MP104C]
MEWDPEIRLYVGFVSGIPGAHTHGATLDKLHQNLKEVLELCLEELKAHQMLDNLPARVFSFPIPYYPEMPCSGREITQYPSNGPT